MLTVRDLLKVKGDTVWTVSPQETTIEALRMLAEFKVGALPVVEAGKIVGIISERDFVRQIARDGICNLTTPVSSIMTREVVTVRPQETIDECMHLMTDEQIRHLPVIDEGKLAGVISIGDVVKAVIDNQSKTINSLENYISGTGYGQ